MNGKKIKWLEKIFFQRKMFRICVAKFDPGFLLIK